MSEFIPNSFQTPNAYVDQFMAFLTPEEWMLLSYAVRRIFGFQKRMDRISYSQFMNGITNQEGEQLDYGTGLGMSATKNGLASLIRFRLLIELEPNDMHKNEGKLYALQLDSALVDTEGLMQRHYEKKTREKARMHKARLSITPPSNEQTPVYPLDAPPVYPLDAPPPLMDSVNNNQGNPVEKQSPAKIESTSHKAMFGMLARLCKLDMKIKRGQLNKTAKTLLEAGYTLGDMDLFEDWWKEHDFRGQRGDPPTLNQIADRIYQAKQEATPKPSKNGNGKRTIQLPGGKLVEVNS
jgi:hypothetical protein